MHIFNTAFTAVLRSLCKLSGGRQADYKCLDKNPETKKQTARWPQKETELCKPQAGERGKGARDPTGPAAPLRLVTLQEGVPEEQNGASH